MHYASTVCKSLTVIHVHFIVKQLVAPCSIHIGIVRCIVSTEEGDFASVKKKKGISKWKFINSKPFSKCYKVVFTLHCSLKISVITKLITCMK